MFLLLETEQPVDRELSTASKLGVFIEKLGLTSRRRTAAKGEAIPSDKDELLLFAKGIARIELGGTALCFIEKHDVLFGGSMLLKGGRCIAEYDTEWDSYSRKDLEQEIRRNAELSAFWDEFVQAQESLQFQLRLHLSLTRDRLPPRRYFEAGAPIIIQGTTPTEVYRLLRGEAEVYYGKIQVGIVKEGEIFGALAPINYSERSASVLASTFCAVAVFQQRQFLYLLQTHPRTMLKLIEDMSNVIIRQNERLDRMQKEQLH